MPVKFGRLGLGESPWEHVRNHAFEWEHEGRIKKAGHKKRRHEKDGAPLPQPVKPAGGRRPASSLFTLDYSDLAAA